MPGAADEALQRVPEPVRGEQQNGVQDNVQPRIRALALRRIRARPEVGQGAVQ